MRKRIESQELKPACFLSGNGTAEAGPFHRSNGKVWSRHGSRTVAKKESAVEENVAEEKPKETTVEFLASLAAVLVTGLFIITFVVQAFEIPSSSMENTLLIEIGRASCRERV